MIIDVNSQINKDNALLLRQLALYLNLMPDAIDAKMLDEIAPGMSKENREYAFAALLAVYCGFDTEQSAKDKAMFHNYFTRMIHRQEKSEFIADSYYKICTSIDFSFKYYPIFEKCNYIWYKFCYHIFMI